jgi:hypothetical protein
MKFLSSRKARQTGFRSGQRGMALVIVLSLVVLVTVTVVAFFTRATGNRSVAASRANRGVAAQMAETGADYTVAKFLADAAPGNTNILPPVITNSSGFSDVNLIRQSVFLADPGASSDNTATPSRNGVSLSATRWSMPQLLVSGGFPDTNSLPGWIYVNQYGSITNKPGSNSVGRFAYNAYDAGGLLDINVAGHPSSIVPGDANYNLIRGTLAAADLSTLTNIAVDSFIAWRNPSTAGDPSSYANAVVNAAGRGFLAPQQGDNYFLTRQDLIAAASNPIVGIGVSCLPYLTHFTRELARPSVSLPGGATNLMTSRYALSQLSNPATASTIFTADISQANPDFFSLIYSGVDWSVNSDVEVEGPAPMSAGSGFAPDAWTSDLKFKSVALGANVIDQFSRPIGTTDATLLTDPESGNVVAGKLNLPYLAGAYALYSVTSANLNEFTFDFSILPEAWTPPECTYLTPMLAGTISADSKLTLSISYKSGGAVVATANADGGSVEIDPSSGSPFVDAPGASSSSTPPAPIPAFTFSDFPATSVVLQGNGNPSSPLNLWGRNFVLTVADLNVANGFFHQTVTVPPPNSYYDSSGSEMVIDDCEITVTVTINDLSLVLSGSNINYNAYGQDAATPPAPPKSLSLSLNHTDTFLWSAMPKSASSPVAGIAVTAEDPRTVRNAGDVGEYKLSENSSLDLSKPDTVSLPRVSNQTHAYTLNALNTKIYNTSYRPPTNAIGSVGDLGAVFRENPFRTIDFCSGTNNSPDWRLLDLCSTYPAPSSGVRGGVVNLNSRQTNVLAAILSGAVTMGTNTLASDDIGKIVGDLTSNNAVTPMEHRSSLVEFVSTNSSLAVASGVTINSQVEKQGLEAPIRALGEVGQTRTWNLLIDVVAQAGRFPPGTTSFTGDQFVVGGEDRVWVSVAIDRITGKVIDRQTEVVKE